MYVKTRDLPASVQQALSTLGYHRADIEVQAAETWTVESPAYGDGYRGFTAAINLETAECRIAYGSWGGANPFATSAADADDRVRSLPPNAAVIQGSTGHKTFARMHVHPAAIVKFLPAERALTRSERDALYCFKAIKGGAYRFDELRRRGVSSLVVDELVSRGLLAKNKTGACRITTDGKNALGSWHGSWNDAERAKFPE